MAEQITEQSDTHEDDQGGDVTIQYISPQEGTELLDRQARKYLGMSGEEFKRRYREGTIEDPERADVLAIAFLLPLAEE